VNPSYAHTDSQQKSTVTDDAAPSIIAVVDDEPTILESLQDLLESANHIVRTFSSATALVESRYLGKIDCLISDIGMPVMDGFELVRIAHAIRPTLPIILISGHAHILDGLPPVLRGQYRVLTKPLHGELLLAAVSEALGTAAARQ
jgi:FixJ family two-component response regulator